MKTPIAAALLLVSAAAKSYLEWEVPGENRTVAEVFNLVNTAGNCAGYYSNFGSSGDWYVTTEHCRAQCGGGYVGVLVVLDENVYDTSECPAGRRSRLRAGAAAACAGPGGRSGRWEKPRSPNEDSGS